LLDRHKDITQGVLLGLFSVTWIVVSCVSISKIEKYDPLTIIRVLTLVAVIGGVFVAVWKLYSDQKYRQSESYLNQAKEFFEKSYSTLYPDGTIGYPENSRLRWLSCARLLQSALDLEVNISDASHKHIFNEYKFFWHIKYHELLKFDEPEIIEKHYFYEEGKIFSWSPGDREPVAESSIATLYRFTQWPEEREDRRADFTPEERHRIETFCDNGLRGYVRERYKKLTSGST